MQCLFVLYVYVLYVEVTAVTQRLHPKHIVVNILTGGAVVSFSKAVVHRMAFVQVSNQGSIGACSIGGLHIGN